MTLDELETELDACGVNLQIHGGFHSWVVWLYAPDDPEFLFQAAEPTLDAAVADVVAQWNGRGGRRGSSHELDG